MPLEDTDFPPEMGDAEVGPIPAAATGTLPRDPSVTTPDHPVLESHREPVEDVSGSTVTEKDPVPEFDPRVREEFDGLLFLGRLTDTFEAYGHQFVVRTLSTGEVLEVGLLHKPYKDTISEVKAYQAALVAACVVSVDGRPMPLPVTNDPMDTALANRFQYVLRSWFPPLLDVIYERYLLLEAKVDAVLGAMGNPSR